MTFRRMVFVVFGLCLAPVAALAQALQLPTFSYTTVDTSVLVPDQGSAFLGGISRASDGRSEFGVPMLPFRPFKNTAIGQSRSSMNQSVTVTIHDFDEMERALLGTSPAEFAASAAGAAARGLASNAIPTPRRNLAGQWQPKIDLPGSVSPVGDLATEQARRVALGESRAAEAQQYFEKARQAEADGKPNVAKIYYRMVVRRGNGDLKTQALARLDAMSGTTARLAQGAE